jgi:hypothetical protein
MHSQKRSITLVAVASLPQTASVRCNEPYGGQDDALTLQDRVPYELCSDRAPPSDTPKVDVFLGGVLFGLKGGHACWIVKLLTGVTPLAIRELRGPGRRSTGLFKITVRQDEGDRVISASETALCLPTGLWVPTPGSIDVSKVAKMRKVLNAIRNAAQVTDTGSVGPLDHKLYRFPHALTFSYQYE